MISGFDPEDNLDIDVRDGKYISTFKVITPIIIYETGTSNIIFKCYLFYNVLTESIFKNILSTNVEIINNNGYYYFSNDKTHETYGFFNNDSSFEKWNDYNSYDPTTTSTVQGSKVGVASSISYYKINPVDISDSVNSLTSADINIQNTETLLIITLSKDYSINYFYKAIRIWTYLAVFIIFIFSYFFTKIIDSIITNRNITLDEYKRIANTDELTNLSNRKKAFNDLKDKLSKHIDFGLLFMDLDGFKDINDKYGHDVGDRVLIESANRFRSYLKEDLTVYRIGGDEFLVISENPDKDFLSETAKNLILVCNKPLISSGVNEKLGLSIGISYIKDSNKSLDKLIDEADNAMYEIKKDCKNSFKFFNE